MEVYKLPDVHGEYSLDYCTKNQDNTIDFSYNGTEGHYDRKYIDGMSRGVLTFNNVDYIFNKEKYSDTDNAFTREDLPVLIALARESFLMKFPFKIDSKNIVTLKLPEDWLFDLGESILQFDVDAHMFYIKRGVLYVDDKPVEAHAISKFYKADKDTYAYGLQTEHPRFCVSKKFRAGCKVEQLQELLVRLPIKDSSYYIRTYKGYADLDSRLEYRSDMKQEVSVMSFLKVVNLRLPNIKSDNEELIEFEIKSFCAEAK